MDARQLEYHNRDISRLKSLSFLQSDTRCRGLEGDGSRVDHAIRLKRKWGKLVNCLDGFKMSQALKNCFRLLAIVQSLHPCFWFFFSTESLATLCHHFIHNKLKSFVV